MVQNQLIDYVSSQIKTGVSREAVKAALIAAGWPAADVEDTLKKVEGGDKPAMSTGGGAPAGVMAAGAANPSTSPAMKPASMIGGAAQKSSEPQSIRVSDLVSASAAATPVTKSFLSGASGTSRMIGTLGTSGGKTPPPAGFPADMSTGAAPARKGRAMMIVGIVLIIALAGLAGYLYFQNTGLAGQVASLNGQSSNVAAQLSSLSNQVQGLTASNTALTANVASLTAENIDLLSNLSFIAIPAGASGMAASGTVSVNGTLTGGKSSYVLTTTYGVVVYVANIKNATLTAALAPLVNGTTTVELTGTHTVGSQYLTVTAVNGSPLQ